MIRIGILGGAGYTAGELLRILLNHPQAEVVFVNSSSNAGNRIDSVHEGLIGDTDMTFTDQMPLSEIDLLFFCFGHGKSREFLAQHDIPDNVRIIDFIPYRGDFPRGIFCTEVVRFDGEEGTASNPTIGQLETLYKDFYKDEPFTHYTDRSIDLKQVVNTNKALLHIDKFGNKAVITSIIDNLLKGAAAQAVQVFNMYYDQKETEGLF